MNCGLRTGHRRRAKKGVAPLAGCASVLLAALPLDAARADCTLSGNGTLECRGTIGPTGVDNAGISGDVHVQYGTTITGGTPSSNAGVAMGPSGGLLNDGSITGNASGVSSEGVLVLHNNGVINGVVSAVAGQGPISGTNNGLIQGQTFGIATPSSLQLENNGRITARIGMQSQSLDLKNNGTVDALNVGVDVTGTGSGNAKVVNDGTISVANPSGLAIRAAGNLEVTNRAAITGGISAFGINATNKGTIDGQAGAAFYSIGAFNLTNNGTIKGRSGAVSVDGAATITNGGAITSSGAGGATIAATSLSMTNNSQVSASGEGATAVRVANDAAITNNALISASSNGTAISIGRNATISNGGEISVGVSTDAATPSIAIAVGNSASISNDGVIAAGGNGSAAAYGIFSTGESSVTNRGRISVTGANAVAVAGAGTMTLTNSGTVSASGANAIGFFAAGTANLNNSGTLTGEAYGAAGNVLNVANSSTITGGIAGVQAAGTANIDNKGRISGGTVGIGAGDSVNVTNTGVITGGVGIQVSGASPSAGSSITNNGTIVGTSGTAIRLTGAADTLTIGRNSRISGLIAVGGGGDTINLDAGGHRSQILAFDTLQGAKINVNAANWQRVGNAIVVVDTTTQQMADRSVNDITDAVRDITLGRISAPVNRRQSNTGFYIEPFGGSRRQSETSRTAAYTATHAGAVVGVENVEISPMRIGAFVGGALGNARASGTDPLSHSANYGIAGAYGRYSHDIFYAEAAITGGITSGQSTRTVVSNMLAAGQATVTGHTSGKFLSPEVGVGADIAINDTTSIKPSVHYRYTVSGWNGMTENDPVAGLALGGRSTRTSEFRAEVTGSHTYRYLDGTLHVYETLGVISRRSAGSDLIAQIAGTAVSIDPTGPRTTLGLFAIAGLEWRGQGAYSLFANLRGEWHNDKNAVFAMRAGAMMRF